MEILWWLAPAGVVTVAAMAWVSWLGREGRGEVDRDVAVARLAQALSHEPTVTARTAPRVTDRSTGIAVRPSRDRSTSGPRA